MAATNLDLWNRLEKTDPSRTKQFSRSGGFKGTAINATYIKKRLTEAFGPCGQGWKFVLENERIEDGHKLKSGDTAKLHIVRGHIEYCVEGNWYQTSPQFGQTMLVDENKYGTFTDEEAPKKSITDCTTKCAVDLGLSADIHLGLFDDNRYVNDRREEERKSKLEQAAERNPAKEQGKTNRPNNQTRELSPPTTDVVAKAQQRFEECSNLEDAKSTMMNIYNALAESTKHKYSLEKIEECVMQFKWLDGRFTKEEMKELQTQADRLTGVTAQLEEALTV